MTDAPDFLRAGGIARLAGVSLRTVRRWIADGALPSRRKHFPQPERLRRHARRRRTGHGADPLDRRDHVPVAGAGHAGPIKECEQVR
jgi:predicted DNA-binding transcriptional regulator AlpA